MSGKAMSRTLVAMMGPVAAGKTTFAQRVAAQTGWEIIGSDDIRLRHGLQAGRDDHETFTRLYQRVQTGLRTSTGVIVDTTAVTHNVRERLRRIARENQANAILAVVHAPLKTTTTRNQKRSDPVPEQAVRDIYAAYERAYPLTAREPWDFVEIVNGLGSNWQEPIRRIASTATSTDWVVA